MKVDEFKAMSREERFAFIKKHGEEADMRDRNSVEELAHDTSDLSDKKVDRYLDAAMDELIDRLFSGRKVGRFYLDAYVEQFAEDIAAVIIIGTEGNLRSLLEAWIRIDLTDSDEVRELAAQYAREKPDE